VVVPEFGFYGRPMHVRLIRENRLIAGVNSLNELEPKLRQAVSLMPEKKASGSTVEDAEVLAKHARLAPGTTGFTDFVQAAIG
jgi:hypothetical protein